MLWIEWLDMLQGRKLGLGMDWNWLVKAQAPLLQGPQRALDVILAR